MAGNGKTLDHPHTRFEDPVPECHMESHAKIDTLDKPPVHMDDHDNVTENKVVDPEKAGENRSNSPMAEATDKVKSDSVDVK